MDISVLISRTQLGLSPLQLEDLSSGYEVVSIGPGGRVMRLQHATSAASDGAVLTQATAGLESARLTIRVWGEDPGEVLERLVTLERALNQWSYAITVSIDGTSETWRCHPANYARGLSGTYSAAALAGCWQELTAEIPRQPRRYAY